MTEIEASPISSRDWAGSVFAGIIAALDWVSLAIDIVHTVGASLTEGYGLPEALFLYFRYFTILTNLGIAVLMTGTALRVLAHRPWPPARLYNAALVYAAVTCVTYEVMLRSQWSPLGMQFVTDIVFHDLVPALVLVFWLVFAPRDGLKWRDTVWILAYPAAYFAVTLIAGALDEGYPYHFFDVDKLGYRTVLIVAVMFLAAFYLLGLATTALGMAWGRPRQTRERSQMV